MKIISLGLDASALDFKSSLASRLRDYGDLVDTYTVFVPSRFDQIVDLSNKVRVYGIGGRNKLVQLIKIFIKVNQILTTNTYSLITVQDPYYLGLIGLFLVWKFNLKIEVQIHGFEKNNSWFRKIISRFLIKRANGLRVVSHRLKKELMEGSLIPENRITVIPIYSPYSHCHQEMKQYTAHDPFNFLTVSRLVPVKNITLQLEALAEVVKKYPQVRLTIVGTGPDQNNLSNVIDKLKLTHFVKMVGVVEKVDSFYKEADVFLLTSNSEGWGLVVIEAASYGLPIIMTDVGCAGEVIKDNKSGLIISIGNNKELVEAMMVMIQNESLRTRLGQEALQMVSLLPSKSEILNLYRQAWERLR